VAVIKELRTGDHSPEKAGVGGLDFQMYGRVEAMDGLMLSPPEAIEWPHRGTPKTRHRWTPEKAANGYPRCTGRDAIGGSRRDYKHWTPSGMQPILIYRLP